MPTIALTGIRGGVGVTSTTAALAFALEQLNESVLIIDLSPSNLLRLYFNDTLGDSQGWACALIQSQPWYDTAREYSPHLSYLPFGNLTVDERLQLNSFFKQNPQWWLQEIQRISQVHYRWILLDCPQEWSLFETGFSLDIDAKLTVLNADSACHILLHQDPLLTDNYQSPLRVKDNKNHHFLLNKLIPQSRLQQDIYQLWRASLTQLLPIALHHDESMAEALAHKEPLGAYAPSSLASEELITLANWLLIHYPPTKG